MNSWRRWLIVLAAVLVWPVLAWPVPAQAHLTPNSEVRLTFGEREVIADVVVPRSEFAYATGLAADDTPAATAAAAAYLARNIAARSPDGRPWRVTVGEARFVTMAGPPDLHAAIRLTPPEGAPADRFALEWHVVTREVPSHFALVVEGGDLSGRDSDERRLVGALTAADPVLVVQRTAAGRQGLVGAMVLGARHIAEGYDHLLFLLALLVSAPLAAGARRWTGHRDARSTLHHLALTVTGFTVGHSLTLIASTLLDTRLPTAPVEVGIALSVMVAAAHAIRPIFPGREPLVAALFGLVHGLAFATLVSDLGLARDSRALALLGFNLGIEAVQLAIVVAALPAIRWLTQDPARARYRVALSAAIFTAAAIWLVDRVSGRTLGISGTMEYALPWALGVLGLFSLATGLIALARRRPSVQPG